MDGRFTYSLTSVSSGDMCVACVCMCEWVKPLKKNTFASYTACYMHVNARVNKTNPILRGNWRNGEVIDHVYAVCVCVCVLVGLSRHARVWQSRRNEWVCCCCCCCYFVFLSFGLFLWKRRFSWCIHDDRRTRTRMYVCVSVWHLSLTSWEVVVGYAMSLCKRYTIRSMYGFLSLSLYLHTHAQHARVYVCVCVWVNDVLNALT